MAAKKPTPKPAPRKSPPKPAQAPRKPTKPAAGKGAPAPKGKPAPAKAPAPKPAAKAKAPAPKPVVAPKPVAKAPAPKPAPKAPAPAPKAPAPAPKPENAARAEKIAQVRPPARSRGHTPSIFKAPAKKGPPIVFSLEDVKETLEHRKQPTTPPFSAAQAAAAASAAPASAPAPAAARKGGESHKDGPREVRRLGAASLADLLGGRAQPKRTAVDPADESKVPQKWKKYYRLLLDLRRHVSEGLHFHVQDTLKRSPREDSGDLSGYGQHMADAGTDTFDRDFALSLVSSEQEALAEIEAAIQRIFAGTYGTCEITGQPIGAERLEAVPFTRYSVAGQAEFERQNRRRVQRGGLFLDASVEDAANFADEDSED